jgi:LAO/AO transport system kinase
LFIFGLQMIQTGEIISGLEKEDHRALARAISLVENDLPGSEEILFRPAPDKKAIVVGITGPPGAGKSTLINALASLLVQKYKVAILAIDPTSPFTNGSLLGDRLRMPELFTNKNIFIRSLATRGSLGGLSAKAIEIIDVLKSAWFDFILVETVGVGQSEVEIASIADTTVVVFVPESGDEIQTIKSGIMEIADIFVVNKADREGADLFAKNIRQLLHNRPYQEWNIPVIKTIALRSEGISELVQKIELHQQVVRLGMRHELLLQKAVHLIMAHKMKSIDKIKLEEQLKNETTDPSFNLYSFIKKNYQ